MRYICPALSHRTLVMLCWCIISWGLVLLHGVKTDEGTGRATNIKHNLSTLHKNAQPVGFEQREGRTLDQALDTGGECTCHGNHDCSSGEQGSTYFLRGERRFVLLCG